MTFDELEKVALKEIQARQQIPHTIDVCLGTTCLALQGDKLKAALEQEAARHPVGAKCRVRGVGCPGLCALGPLVAIKPDGLLYKTVKPEDAPDIINSLDAEPVARLRCDTEQPFFTRQTKIVLENSGNIDPERLEDYIAAGGYQALLKALTEMTPSEVIDEITRSGLRGRGGAGFPTGLKWRTVAKAAGDRKYVVCNGDEGDPGAFMDRSVMESDPHRVLEGMAIAAYAVGAGEGFIYVRAEYPLAVKRLKQAIMQARSHGLLGVNIGGTAFTFRVEVRLGAGAFVCGEETALMASIEGKRGTPRPRPPYPAESGLWRCPTLINNVETFANVPTILRRGADWFAGIGTAKSKGTKVFALTGRVQNTGLIEVPMG
ncbi:MAG: NAD(P)H-dependent oxidoreductase subunit E, partial [Anaerolineales bacterium]|nr:NAD(P)H-dependent oxidoreductase subunit E [Anaerolineales bacterium]